MRVSDIVEYLVGFVTGIASVDASDFDTPTFRRDIFTIQQINVLIALRELAAQNDAIFTLSAESSPALIFEAAKAITAINIDSLDTHEYVVAINRSLAGKDAAIIREISIGKVSDEVFTRFIVKGADERYQKTRTNYTLEALIGRKERKPEVFNKVTSDSDLQEYIDTLYDVFGLQLIEGELVVDGYFPSLNNRLDINAIIRVLDPAIENGTDLTGTANVFKVYRLEYDGELNKTKILLSNRSFHRSQIGRLEELRTIMSGIQNDDPDGLELIGLTTGTFDAASNLNVFMALTEGGTEISSVGYERQKATLNIHDDGFAGYSAFFAAGVGHILNDICLIDGVALYAAKTGGAALKTITFTDPRDKIAKWPHISLHFTFDVQTP